MKKVLFILTVLSLFAACEFKTVSTVETTQEDDTSMFVYIERTTHWFVVYNKETKVMYAVSYGTGNQGEFTLLVNPDGTPQIYQGQ